MPRILRNTAILAKVETTYKTDAVPTGAANALLVSNMSITPLNAQNVNRDLVRGYFGGSDQLVGTSNVQTSFDVELAGSGAAGTAPAWGALLQACGYAEVVTSGQRVEYTPVSTGIKSVTIYYYLDGTLHKLIGARGTFQLRADMQTGRPVISFSFTGLDGGIAAAANPAMALAAWKTPVA
ncbi:MAG: phage tail tube protein, partial [Burkholderiaceae bacterium]